VQSTPTSSQFRQTLAELASHSRLTGSVDLDDRLASSSLRDPSDPDTADGGNEMYRGASDGKDQLGTLNTEFLHTRGWIAE